MRTDREAPVYCRDELGRAAASRPGIVHAARDDAEEVAGIAGPELDVIAAAGDLEAHALHARTAERVAAGGEGGESDQAERRGEDAFQ
jgi:hypothetical protein